MDSVTNPTVASGSDRATSTASHTTMRDQEVADALTAALMDGDANEADHDSLFGEFGGDGNESLFGGDNTPEEKVNDDVGSKTVQIVQGLKLPVASGLSAVQSNAETDTSSSMADTAPPSASSATMVATRGNLINNQSGSDNNEQQRQAESQAVNADIEDVLQQVGQLEGVRRDVEVAGRQSNAEQEDQNQRGQVDQQKSLDDYLRDREETLFKPSFYPYDRLWNHGQTHEQFQSGQQQYSSSQPGLRLTTQNAPTANAHHLSQNDGTKVTTHGKRKASSVAPQNINLAKRVQQQETVFAPAMELPVPITPVMVPSVKRAPTSAIRKTIRPGRRPVSKVATMARPSWTPPAMIPAMTTPNSMPPQTGPTTTSSIPLFWQQITAQNTAAQQVAATNMAVRGMTASNITSQNIAVGNINPSMIAPDSKHVAAPNMVSQNIGAPNMASPNVAMPKTPARVVVNSNLGALPSPTPTTPMSGFNGSQTPRLPFNPAIHTGNHPQPAGHNPLQSPYVRPASVNQAWNAQPGSPLASAANTAAGQPQVSQQLGVPPAAAQGIPAGQPQVGHQPGLPPVLPQNTPAGHPQGVPQPGLPTAAQKQSPASPALPVTDLSMVYFSFRTRDWWEVTSETELHRRVGGVMETHVDNVKALEGFLTRVNGIYKDGIRKEVAFVFCAWLSERMNLALYEQARK
ncbi:hypothetical protein QBC40DRAFT_248749 [Triangularia verruculosa]|uniref:Uncharacterized protein n=1 Tax=Triangularia verruculosa TaxID=2587418 RepID=A0AAN6XS70_9PEZI|nr:hypothetical protein QBC40DRAFT_248749 [Triangularia verruculosa]